MQSTPTVLLKDLLKNVSEVDILNFYIPIKELPCLISSPLRVDNKPSFSIYVTTANKVKYRDLAKKESGGLFDLLGKLWGLSFPHVLGRIQKDLKYIPTSQIPITEYSANYHSHLMSNAASIKKLEVKLRPYTTYDLEYWNQFGLPKSALLFADIYPVSDIIIHKGDDKSILRAHKYAYAYIERKDGNTTYKIYQPYNLKCKWLNSHNSSVWDLWSKLPKYGDKVIITSSRKDAICLWYHLRVPAVSLQGEGYIPKEGVINELKSRFKEVYVLFDNDYNKERNVGRENASHLCSLYNLIFIEIPAFLQSKDPSDLYYNQGSEIFKDTMIKLLYEKEINSLFEN